MNEDERRAAGLHIVTILKPSDVPERLLRPSFARRVRQQRKRRLDRESRPRRRKRRAELSRRRC